MSIRPYLTSTLEAALEQQSTDALHQLAMIWEDLTYSLIRFERIRQSLRDQSEGADSGGIRIILEAVEDTITILQELLASFDDDT